MFGFQICHQFAHEHTEAGGVSDEVLIDEGPMAASAAANPIG